MRGEAHAPRRILPIGIRDLDVERGVGIVDAAGPDHDEQLPDALDIDRHHTVHRPTVGDGGPHALIELAAELLDETLLVLDGTIGQNAVQQAEGDYVNAVYDYHKAVAALEAAVGRPLR